MENTLWYTAPAANWNETLPLGNGRLGAMVFGGVQAERFALNHDTLWSGAPKNKTPTDLTAFFAQSIQAAQNGDYAAAQQILEQHLCTAFDEGYLPMGDLLLARAAPGPITDYRRTLDLQTGTATVQYTGGGVRFTQTAFASAPDQALVITLTADAPVLAVTLSLQSQLRGSAALQNGLLLYTGECPTHVEPPYVQSNDPILYDTQRHGIGFCFGVAVQTDGQSRAAGDSIGITGARSITLYLTAETSFVDYKTEPYDPTGAYVARCTAHLQALRATAPAALYARHLADYAVLDGRCTLTLQNQNRAAAALPTNERLKAFAAARAPGNGPSDAPPDTGLFELLFRFGRYLLFSSSRPGTQAANLQGIWNDQMRAPWSANYTLNINTEMNYWPAYMANLADCAAPLVALVQDLAETGAAAAKNLYGVRGWVSHHNTDLWRAANPVGNHESGCACYGYWPLSAAWLCRPVYEQYEYTRDETYLKQTALPLMQGAAKFIEEILQADVDGALILCPATSPENNFVLDGATLSVAKSTAMSQSIAWDLFENCRKACLTLGQTQQAAHYAALQAKLKPLQIGPDGRILEWNENLPEHEPHHRHISHLYALHPGGQISPAKTPKLAAACRKSLQARGDAGTGWSLAWKVNAWARLGDGKHAYRLLQDQLHPVAGTTVDHFAGGGSYPNLFCAHPPFQIDGNFGAVSGMLEMLVQSEAAPTQNTITLLPALPPQWPCGSVTGVLTRAGVQVDVRWQGGALQDATLLAAKPCTCTVLYSTKVRTLTLQPGQPTPLTFD